MPQDVRVLKRARKRSAIQHTDTEANTIKTKRSDRDKEGREGGGGGGKKKGKKKKKKEERRGGRKRRGGGEGEGGGTEKREGERKGTIERE